jgi:hypothetical protein
MMAQVSIQTPAAPVTPVLIVRIPGSTVTAVHVSPTQLRAAILASMLRSVVEAALSIVGKSPSSLS